MAKKEAEKKKEEKKTGQPDEQAVKAEAAKNAEPTREQLLEQLAAAKDMLLRTAAEFDNYKKRENASRERLGEFVKGETLKELLPAVDNLNLALVADDGTPEYIKGVSMSVKGLLAALEKLGLVQIYPLNEQFDAQYHLAVMRVEDESVGENVVTQVMQAGYRLGDTVLRPAMVKVANCG